METKNNEVLVGGTIDTNLANAMNCGNRKEIETAIQLFGHDTLYDCYCDELDAKILEYGDTITYEINGVEFTEPISAVNIAILYSVGISILMDCQNTTNPLVVYDEEAKAFWLNEDNEIIIYDNTIDAYYDIETEKQIIVELPINKKNIENFN